MMLGIKPLIPSSLHADIAWSYRCRLYGVDGVVLGWKVRFHRPTSVSERKTLRDAGFRFSGGLWIRPDEVAKQATMNAEVKK
jgi:hypothetical protein